MRWRVTSSGLWVHRFPVHLAVKTCFISLYRGVEGGSIRPPPGARAPSLLNRRRGGQVKGGVRLITAVLAVAVAAVQAPSGVAAPSTLARNIQVGGLRRTYLVHVPGSFSRGRPAGLVFVLHGGGGNGRQIER